MIEIIAFIYLFSFLIASVIGAYHFYLLKRQLQSRSLKILNENLRKIDLYWSSNEENFAF